MRYLTLLFLLSLTTRAYAQEFTPLHAIETDKSEVVLQLTALSPQVAKKYINNAMYLQDCQEFEYYENGAVKSRKINQACLMYNSNIKQLQEQKVRDVRDGITDTTSKLSLTLLLLRAFSGL